MIQAAANKIYVAVITENPRLVRTVQLMKKKDVVCQVATQDSISLQTVANQIFVAAGMVSPRFLRNVKLMEKKTVVR